MGARVVADVRLHDGRAVGEDLVERTPFEPLERCAVGVGAGELVVDLVGEQHPVLPNLADREEAALGEIENGRRERRRPDRAPVHQPAHDGGRVVGQVAHVLADLLRGSRLLPEAAPQEQEHDHAAERHDRDRHRECVSGVAFARGVLGCPGAGVLRRRDERVLLGEDLLESRRSGHGEPRHPRRGDRDAALYERALRNLRGAPAHRVGTDRGEPVQRTMAPCPQSIDARRDVQRRSDESDRGVVLADPLPIELGDVRRADDRAGDRVTDVERALLVLGREVPLQVVRRARGQELLSVLGDVHVADRVRTDRDRARPVVELPGEVVGDVLDDLHGAVGGEGGVDRDARECELLLREEDVRGDDAAGDQDDEDDRADDAERAAHAGGYSPGAGESATSTYARRSCASTCRSGSSFGARRLPRPSTSAASASMASAA
jgi:hypothetical protein